MAEVTMSSGRKEVRLSEKWLENSYRLDNTVFSTGIDCSDIKSNMSLWQVIINEE
jgi:hypothetical protein